MTRRKWAAVFGLTLAAVVLLVWVMPLVFGPTVECFDTDPAVCDDIARITVEDNGSFRVGSGIEQFFLMTKVRIWEGGCQIATERAYGFPIFSTYAIC
jgi:hypothetical protein